MKNYHAPLNQRHLLLILTPLYHFVLSASLSLPIPNPHARVRHKHQVCTCVCIPQEQGYSDIHDHGLHERTVMHYF